jgi:hypothetical protein
MALKIPETFHAESLLLRVCVRAYRMGDPPAPPQPTRFTVRSGAWKAELGAPVIPVDDRWHVYDYALRPEDLPGRRFEVFLDDAPNVISPEHHYGKTLGYVLLLGRGRHD